MIHFFIAAGPATARMLLVKLPYTLATEEAERIGLDHVAKISANTDSDTSRAADTLQVGYGLSLSQNSHSA